MDKMKITGGAYHGEQFLDNTEQVSISGTAVKYEVKSDISDPEHPDINEELEVDESLWNTLQECIDLDAFSALPEEIGNPDHADQGAEWVTIEDGDFVRTVRFEEQNVPIELEPVVEHIRSLRRQAAALKGRTALGELYGKLDE